MLAATSCRKAVLKAAASSKVSGGTSRVLVRPGIDAFAITATPQDGSGASPARNRFFFWGTFEGPAGRKVRNDDAQLQLCRRTFHGGRHRGCPSHRLTSFGGRRVS